MSSRKLKIGLLLDFDRSNASTIEDFADGLSSSSEHQMDLLRVRGEVFANLNAYDALVIHYNLIAYPYRGDNFMNEETRLKIANFSGPKLAFVQDEYRNIMERIRFFNSLGINHVFTLASPEVAKVIYPPEYCNFSTSRVLTGYVNYAKLPNAWLSWNERKIDISYRARKLPNWMGRLAIEKGDLADIANRKLQKSNLVLDISNLESERIYGKRWEDHLANSKIVLGTESGASVLDFDGRFDEAWLNESNAKLNARINPVTLDYSAISPRIFEYAANRCLMALTKGEYSGIIEPGEDYFELASDFSNFSELIQFSLDEDSRNRMINSAYSKLIESKAYSYSALAKLVDHEVQRIATLPNSINSSHAAYYENIYRLGRVLKSNSKKMLHRGWRKLKYHLVSLWFAVLGKVVKVIKHPGLYLLARGIYRGLVSKLRSAKKLIMLFHNSNLKVLFQILLFAGFKFTVSHGLSVVLEMRILRRQLNLTSKLNFKVEKHITDNVVWFEVAQKFSRNSILGNFPKNLYENSNPEAGFYFSWADYATSGKPINFPELYQLRMHNPKAKEFVDNLY